ncbi:hypothetical protein RB195_024196 [Necator americanus]|uniref:Uncharacterized protein n=1 Tax=Necator americanus TaxID=51031 RepID=A0ABR1EPH7_NECAM
MRTVFPSVLYSTVDAGYRDISMSRSDGDAVGRFPLLLRIPLLLLREILAESSFVSRASAVVASLLHECAVSRAVIGSAPKTGRRRFTISSLLRIYDVDVEECGILTNVEKVLNFGAKLL